MMKPILYIDTDMGVDDIIAICMLIVSNKFDIRGISVVNGVTRVLKGVDNLSRILKFIGVSIPIYQGVDQKTQGSNVQFPTIDRKRASSLALLPDIALTPINRIRFSLDRLIFKINKEKNPVNIICLGPLSNVAFLLQNQNVRRKISNLTIMGGALNVPGNVPPRLKAEYNFRLDAKAANYVLKSGLPITLVTIDATKSVPAVIKNADVKIRPLLQKFYEKLSDIKTNSSVSKILKSIILNNRGDFDNFYDPLAAAVLIKPELVIRSIKSPVNISLARISMGKLAQALKGTPITLTEKVNTEYFFKILKLLILSNQKEVI